jgi:ribosomal protein L34E
MTKMPSLQRVREYVEAAKRARHCADSERNLQAKQTLHEIERAFYRLVEIEKWMVEQQQYNRPMAHFGLMAMREDIVSPSADQDGRIRARARARASLASDGAIKRRSI